MSSSSPSSVHIDKRIAALQKRYAQAAIGKESLLQLIDEAEVPEQVYDSNAIENSTLTLEETDKILQQINLDRFISERELFEAKNLARVVDYIATKAHQLTPNLDTMLLLHKMLISNIRDDIAGRFRGANEWVRVGTHIAADPTKIRELLQGMLVDYQTSQQMPIIQRMAKFHLTFEHIHPFVDGNGRIGRVLNNYLLIRAGHVPMNIQFVDRNVYYDAFDEFDKTGATKIMQGIVGRALCNSYHKRLAYLEGKTIIALSEYAKSTQQSHSNLLNKAKRQTIEAFIVRGQWKIGV